MGSVCGSLTSSTVTTQPSAQSQQELSQAWTTAQNTAAIPYTGYTGQLTAGLNQGQNAAIGQLQGTYGLAQPYIDSGSQNLSDASGSLGNVSNYLQAGSDAGASAANSYGQATGYGQQSAQALAGMAPYMASANSALGSAGNYFSQAAGLATPMQFSGQALQQYLNPYTQDVINSTMGQLNQNDQVQASNVASSDIGSGAYGGDRNGIAQAALAGQQDLANNQTVAGLNQANYSQAVGQFNQEQADAFQGAGIYEGLGQGSLQQASGYGNLATQQGQIAQQFGNLGTLANQTGSGYSGLGSLYGSLGQAQAGVGADQGQIGALSGYLGSTAQGQAIAGASAGLQGSTLEQQTQQAQDTSQYGQFQNQIAYPFQTSNMLSNVANGQASNLGGATTTGGSLLSSAVGLATAGTTGLGLLASPLSTAVNNIVPNVSNLGAGNNYGNANGGRIGFANGGGLDSAVQHFARGGAMHGLAGLGGVNVMAPIRAPVMAPRAVRHDTRPHFDNGGMPAITFNPTTGQGLASGINVNAANPMFGANTGLAAGSGGGGMGVGGAGGTPRPRAPQQSQGLGALASAPTGSATGLGSIPTTGAAPSTDTSSTPDTSGAFGLSKNASLALMSAGLGMMAGTSGNGLANIGQGGLEGIKTYMNLQQQDVANARAQQDLGIKQQDAQTDSRRVDLGVNQLNELANYHKAQIANETAGMANQTASTASENAARQAGLVTTTPGIDPNTGNPGMWMFDRSKPEQGYKFLPLTGGSGSGSAPAAGGQQPSSSAPISFGTPPTAQPSGGVGGAPVPPASPSVSAPSPVVDAAAAARSVPNAAPMGGATGSWDGPTPSMTPGAGQSPQPTGVLGWQPTKAPPQGYVPPNQAMINLNPDLAKQQADLGGKFVEAQRDAFSKATAAQQQLAEMNTSIDNLPRTGILAPGSYGTQRAAVAQLGNTVASVFGAAPVFDDNQSADTQELKKDAFRLGSQMLANTNGGREAGFIIKASVGATPSLDNTYAGFKKVSSGLQQANQYAMDRAEFMDNYYSKFGHVSGAEAEFQKLNPWQTYAQKAVVGGIDPRAVSYLQQNPNLSGQFDAKYGAGTSKMVLGQ